MILSSLEKRLDGCHSEEDKVKELFHLFEVFVNHFFVVVISSGDRTEAFQIFQTVNARGLDLSSADLIRSAFFGNAGRFQSSIIKDWDYIQTTLSNLSMSDYIRYVWNSEFQFTTARKLYKNVSHRIRSAEGIQDFTHLLAQLARPYAEVMDSTDVVYLSDTKEGERLKNLFDELRQLKFKTFVPIYLAMVNQDYSEKEMLTVMEQVARVLVWNQILNHVANRLEVLFSDVARTINTEKWEHSEMVTAVNEMLQNDLPEKSQVKLALETMSFEKKAASGPLYSPVD